MQNQKDTPYRWLILGGGAIGSLLALLLRKQLGLQTQQKIQLQQENQPQQALSRLQDKAQIQPQQPEIGFIDTRCQDSSPSACRLTLADRTDEMDIQLNAPSNLQTGEHFTIWPATTDWRQADQSHHPTILVVTTKAWQVEVALTPLIHRLPEHWTILLLHNGMGTADWVKTHFPQQTILCGVTSRGARRLGSVILATGAGETWIGPANSNATLTKSVDVAFSDHAEGTDSSPAVSGAEVSDLAVSNSGGANTERIAEAEPDWMPLLRQALGHAAWTPQIEQQQWRKLVINAVINPLTALSGQVNGSLLERTQEIAALCQELTPVLQAQGLTETRDEWLALVQKVAMLTATNRSSMLTDLEAHRPTEIDQITGHLLRTAHQLGLALPLHSALYQTIRAAENTNAIDD